MSGPASRLILSAAPRGAGLFTLDAAAWAALPAALRQEPELELMALWADGAWVHAAFRSAAAPAPVVASLMVEGDRFPALSPARPGAAWFERAIADLWGWQAEGGRDARPWLDHGRWAVRAPLSPAPPPRIGEPPQPVFLPAEGEGVHQFPLGPVMGSLGEPAHHRFQVLGEAIVRLELLLGYTHKGLPALWRGQPPLRAAPLVARLSGDSTLAHSWAFAGAVERALGVEVPPRAVALRGVLAELERLANHLRDIGALSGEAGFAWPQARLGALCEVLLRASQAAFGHRLLMDRVIPGGLAADIAPDGREGLRAALRLVAAELPAIRDVLEEHASLQDRISGCGVLKPEWASLLGAGGVVGRAAGRGFDARRDLAYPPYDRHPPAVPQASASDVEARLTLRWEEILVGLPLIEALLDSLPAGEVCVPLPARGGEASFTVEGFRGEVFCWVALDEAGLVAGCFPRDPSWLLWPLLEAAMENNILADLPLISRSFNASVSGVDL
ncbi:hydrogenase large subunit [Roseomonas sp. USHLN139]|uniref:hydrogenase large subunit n=1 Tax=Roseomonas sp. USHLN139 TaxID=3081298 RepID=UPI003B022B66